MLELTTDSRITSIDLDDRPAIAIGSTMFWQDDQGYWQTVEIIDCEPVGWGWCCIKWHTPSGWHTQSIPFAALIDLDTYCAMQDDYGRFEADGWDYPGVDEDAAYDDYHDREAIIRLGYGG